MEVTNWIRNLVLIFVISASCDGLPHIISVGGIFDEKDYEHQIAFLHAIEHINKERILSPSRLVGITERVDTFDEFQVYKSVCGLLSTGITSVFGPTSGDSADFVQSVCDNKEMPHVQTRWDLSQPRQSILVNLYPATRILSRVYVDLVLHWGWKSFTILYEDESGLSRISGLLTMYDNTGFPVHLRQLDEIGAGDYRPVLTETKKAGETHFVLECSADNLDEILKQAQQVGLMSDAHNYIIIDPDMQTIDLSPYQWGGSNITGIRMVDPEDEDIVQIARELQERKMDFDLDLEEDREVQFKFRIKTALIYDAVYLFSDALRHLNHMPELRSLYCNATDSWEHGLSLITYMRTSHLQGLTGDIKFDHEGFRTDFKVDIVELTTEGLKKVGTWNSSEGVNITRPPILDKDLDDGSLHNKSFVVLTSLTDPYGMLKEASRKLTGNERFEGFGIDLIQELAAMLGFNYTFRLQDDSVYGSLDRKTGQWTGMIRELMEYRADLAVTDFTVTSERESGVDFTMPFMNLGISILYKKPMKMPPKLFSFTSPFSFRVWYYLGGAYFFVSIMLFIIGRICPAEWTNPYPCVDDPEYLLNQFSFKNCFWFTVGSLMQQGSEVAPIGIATRMVAGLWWFFTLIMVSSYTANLAAFLTVEVLYSPIKNIEDLANQNDIKYGAKSGGATANFFRDSNYSIYQKIWNYMETNPTSMTNENPLGVRRANEENYAFLMESTSIEYTIERYCNLTQVGGLLDNKGYGIAMRKNSTYRNILSAAVLKLQESGRLATLKNKWWKEKKGGGACHDDSSSDGAAELTLQNVGGVFLVLVVGSFGGIFVAMGEMLLGVTRRAYRNKVSFKDELVTELKFLFGCKGQTKPNTACKSMSRIASSKSLDEHFPASPYGFIPELTEKQK